MSAGLEPYPEMKDSGVEWLGEVPAHWEVLPNRAIFSEVDDRGHPEEQMLAVTISKGVIPQQALLEDTSKKDSSRLDRSGYKLVQRGDVAYNKMRAWQGALGASGYRGIVSPAYIVQRPRNGQVSRYFHYLLRTPAFAKEAERHSYGIASDMWSLRPEHFRMIYSCVPPLSEQTAIARYLDHMDRRIRDYIRAKEKLIALLEEYKQALISEAVTGQIDVWTGEPYPEYKDSGVEWLGEVPAHWDLPRLGAVLRERGELNHDGVVQDVLSVVRQRGVIPYSEKGNIGNKKSEDISRYKIVRPDDIVLNSMNVIIGSVGLSRYAGCLSPVYYVLTSRSDNDDIRYFNAVFQTQPFQKGLIRLGNGILDHRMRIPMELLKCERLPRPPLPEQTAIAEYLDEATARIDTAIACARRGIDLLGEYRTRLIADVVTGKLDVRGAAAALPDPDPPPAGSGGTDRPALDEATAAP